VHRPGTEAGRRWLVDVLGLEWNVGLASAAIFLLTLREELWQKFLPKYLEVLGASPLLIGLFGSVKNFLAAVYPYPGGWLADHFGRRYAFLLFLAATSLGYLIYLFSPSYPFLFLGLAFVMAWDSMRAVLPDPELHHDAGRSSWWSSLDFVPACSISHRGSDRAGGHSRLCRDGRRTMRSLNSEEIGQEVLPSGQRSNK
jgi:hypothetical protein